MVISETSKKLWKTEVIDYCAFGVTISIFLTNGLANFVTLCGFGFVQWHALCWTNVTVVFVTVLLYRMLPLTHFAMCSGRYCEESLVATQSGLSIGIIVLVAVVSLLTVLVVVLLVLLLCVRSQRKYTGKYRPSNVEHKAGTLPLPTVAGSSTSTTPLHLVGHTKHEVLV